MKLSMASASLNLRGLENAPEVVGIFDDLSLVRWCCLLSGAEESTAFFWSALEGYIGFDGTHRVRSGFHYPGFHKSLGVFEKRFAI